MNNKTNKKLVLLSIIFVVFGLAMTFAATVSTNNYLKVRPVLNKAIQTIQRVAFNEDAIRHTDQEDREVIMESNHGTVMIRGRVLASTSGVNNTLTPDSTGSSLFYGRDNVLAGTDSYIVAGVHNEIDSNVSNSSIIGGTNNKLEKGDNIYIMGGSGNVILNGDSSFIVGGHDNELSGDGSYIIGGSNSKIYGNHSFAAGSNILIDKDYVFAWKDVSDDVVLNPKKSNTFTWFAQNGISIGYNTINNTNPGTTDINGGFQVADEAKTCALNIAGAIQYIGGLYGCFCLCNGSDWVSLTHSKNCRISCNQLTGDVNDDGNHQGVCRYKQGQNNGSNVKIWSIEPSQGCDNGLAKNFYKVDEDGKHLPDNATTFKGWVWECIGNIGDPDYCAADVTVQPGKCAPTEYEGVSDAYAKCAGGYPTNIGYEGNQKNGVRKRTCEGVNSNVKEDCKGCEANWTYSDGVCKNENGQCNGTYNGKSLGSLPNSKELCNIGDVKNFKTGYSVDKRVTGWGWDCVGTGSSAKCNATYKSEPGRCQMTLVKGVENNKYEGYTGIAKFKTCNKGQLDSLYIDEGDHTASWTCSGINFDRNDYCWGCDGDSSYNRHTEKCEANACDYPESERGYKTITTEDGYGAYEVTTCNRKITLMDKNLGANQTGINRDSYGYFYQWGNNHGFTVAEAEQKATTQRVEWSGGYDKLGYSGDTFVIQKKNENTDDKCSFYTYWTNGCTVHKNIWGGGIDGFTSWFYNNQWGIDTLYRVHTNDIEDYIEDWRYLQNWNTRMNITEYMLNTGALSRQGPCPDGWHVPSLGERGILVNDWCLLNPNECEDSDGKAKINAAEGKSIGSITTIKNIDTRFMNKFQLPKAGRLIPDPEHKNMHVTAEAEGFYRSSSPYDEQHVCYLWFYTNSLYAYKCNGEMRWGVPIRCFKNPEIIDDNGGDKYKNNNE